MNRADQLAELFATSVWRVDRAGPALRTQLYRQLRDAVAEGRLAPGAPVPSSRMLARALRVSRSTLVEALEQLRVEGYLDARQGATTRVAALEPGHLLRPPATTGPAGAHAPAADATSPLWVQDDPPMAVTLRAFRPGLPDLRAFPGREWATHLGRRSRQPASHDLSYAACTGVPALREQIIRHVAQTRHVAARADQVIVVPSAQAAFDIVLRCCARPGDTAWIEDPGYPGMRTLLRAHGLHAVPKAVDAEGLLPEPGPHQLPRVIYLTPSHQYPTGATLSLQRRLALLEIARTSGAAIIEDDYDSEFQSHGQPIASLQGLDRQGCVHYVGTFSKTLAPGLRCAYLIVPPAYARLAETVASAAGVGVPIHVQLALADFMADGGLRRHIHRMRSAYAARLGLLHDTLRQSGAGRIVPLRAAGGLQLCAALQIGLGDVEAAQRLRGQGLHAVPLSSLAHGPVWQGRQGLLLGIGLVALDEVAPQARRLCQALLPAG
ncbi:PLP-dependent aminotransferase family protein [Ramlibacter sp.]|uniref:MocR-like pyridoxine biosynthesis transcription factor PdxR n=1 Tax=Ramlibacter sp. TaxID=1917967 RepID=UPI0035B0CB51